MIVLTEKEQLRKIIDDAFNEQEFKKLPEIHFLTKESFEAYKKAMREYKP